MKKVLSITVALLGITLISIQPAYGTCCECHMLDGASACDNGMADKAECEAACEAGGWDWCGWDATGDCESDNTCSGTIEPIYCGGDPVWAGTGCDVCGLSGHYEDGVWDELSCDYDDCCVDCCPAIQGATNVDVAGDVVTVTIGNYHINQNKKHIWIRVQGTGATGDPNAIGLAGVIIPPPAPGLVPLTHIESQDAGHSDACGNWWVEIEAWIIPQPDQVVLTFTVPGAPVQVEAWFSECCTQFHRHDTFSLDSTWLGDVDPVEDPEGTGYGRLWYYYENTNFWNQWFWDDPFVETWKSIKIEFTLIGDPGAVQVWVNWSTPEWSMEGNPPGERRVPPIPPLSPVEEEMYIMRVPLEPPPLPGDNSYVFIIPDYNPEWVSIDIVNVGPGDFSLIDGHIYHQCQGAFPIPAVTEWGLVAMALLVLAAGTIVFRKFKTAAA